MRVRPMRPSDFHGVKVVYEARAAITTGLVRRTTNRWNYWRRMRKPKTLWLVAEEHGRIIGYAIGFWDGGYRDTGEVMWLPEYDGTPVGARILGAMLRRLERANPDTVMIWGIEDSPTLLLPIPSDFERTEATGIFMAGATEASLLLRDAKEILRKRVKGRIRLMVDGRSAVIGKKGPGVTVTMEKAVLLGLLLGTRDLGAELRGGGVTFTPKGPEALGELHLAFPAKKFRIEDGW